MLTKLSQEPGEMQVAALKYCMGAEAEDIMGTFTLSDEERNDFDVVLKKFDEYFQPRKNVLRLRKLFSKRVQEVGESVENYSRALYVMAADCEFGSTKEERIRDQFILGVASSDLSEKLELLHLTKSDVTLATVLDYARNYSDVRQGRAAEAAVNAVRGAQAQRQKNDSQKYPQCKFCNFSHDKGRCPAYGKRCNKCGMRNHFARACLTPQPQEERGSRNPQRGRGQGNRGRGIREVIEEDEDVGEENNAVFLGEVIENPGEAWMTYLEMCGAVIPFKVDSGADVSLISRATFDKMVSKPSLRAPEKKLMTPAGRLEVLGVFQAEAHSKSQNTNVLMDVYVLPDTPRGCGNLLSRSAAQTLRLIQFVGAVEDESLYGFGTWKTDSVSFKMKEDAVPYAVSAARRVPIPLMDAVKKSLMEMEEKGVISKVTEPTDWCAPMVPVIKPSRQEGPGEKKVRICVDYKRLNMSVKREKFSLPTFEELTGKLAGAKIFSKLDAASGFYQIPLDESAQGCTAFITPFGRYKYHRLPMGITLAPEIYQRKMTELLTGLEGVICSMDDVLVFGGDEKEHNQRLQAVLERIKASGLKLNKEKCSFQKQEVTFLGHVITGQGIKVSPAKVEAVLKLDPPTDVAELRKVLGMITYLTRFMPNAQAVLQPLNVLLQSDTAWAWDAAQQDAFKKAKKMLAEAPTLAFFDVTKPTVVSADASSYGIGGVLLQKHGEQWRPVAYCSRMLTKVEQRWAQIEKECLAAVWACERFHTFVCGIEFELQTDHRPLVPLINKKDLSDTPLRCQRLLMRFARYAPTAVYVPGRKLVVADLLSRHPLQGPPGGVADELQRDVDAHVNYVASHLPASGDMLQLIQTKQQEDPEIKQVIYYTLHGWPEHLAELQDLSPYYEVRGHLSVMGVSLLMFDGRIVIPDSLRAQMLQRIHDDGHMSLSKSRERAHASVWWPRLSPDLKRWIDACRFCQTNRRAQHAEPMVSRGLPERPWMKIGADLCQRGSQMYLIVVDYYSRWIEIEHLRSTTSAQVINHMKSLFARWGIPDEVRSDGGPQFTSAEFADFARHYGFLHTLSDPYYPQGNGAAERGVQTAKRIMSQPDPYLALLTYRSTPLDVTGCTPSQLIMGRQLRSRLPTTKAHLVPRWPDMAHIARRADEAKRKSTADFNRRHGARPLPALQPGDVVLTRLPGERRWTDPQQIIGRGGERTYHVRNRRHLQPVDVPYVPDTRQLLAHSEDGHMTPTPAATRGMGEERLATPPRTPRIQRSSEQPPPETTEPAPPPTRQSARPIQTRSGRVSVAPTRLDL